jgi:predicted nucleotidyltransferase
MIDTAHLPAPHRAFLERALPVLADDSRIVGVGLGGSFVAGGFDEFSDLDLVIAVAPDAYEDVMGDRRRIAASLGNVLGAFTGEHVGEPRLLICLYGPTPLHVDLKFVRLDAAADRVEDPAILSDRDDGYRKVLETTPAEYPALDLQWIEDRFWIWIHYGALKVGRGELFEAHDFLAFLRMQVLGPLVLAASDARPSGVRKIEMAAPQYVDRLRGTLGAHDRRACLEALAACADLYVALRDEQAAGDLIRGRSAEIAAREFLDALANE